MTGRVVAGAAVPEGAAVDREIGGRRADDGLIGDGAEVVLAGGLGLSAVGVGTDPEVNVDQSIRVVRICSNDFSLGCLGDLVWLLTALLAVVVISEVFLKVGDIYDFAFFEVCVVHSRCKSFGV